MTRSPEKQPLAVHSRRRPHGGVPTRNNVMSEQKAIGRKLRVELWFLSTIVGLGTISSIFLMIADPTPARLKSCLGLLCIVVATWADGSYRLFLGLTVSQTYREFRAGRGPPFFFAAHLLRLLGLGLLLWAWLG